MPYRLQPSATSPVVVLGAVCLAMMTSLPIGLTQGQRVPELPPGAVRLVNHARHGSQVAICAEEAGPPIEQGVRVIPRTRVWVYDGVEMRQVGTAPGTCDPTWSPDGTRVAVVAPNGLWVLSADLRKTMHLFDTVHGDLPSEGQTRHTVTGLKWAPDASRLAFLVGTGATSWVEIVDATTGHVIHSSDPETYEFAWGTDSRSIIFGSRVVRLP